MPPAERRRLQRRDGVELIGDAAYNAMSREELTVMLRFVLFAIVDAFRRELDDLSGGLRHRRGCTGWGDRILGETDDVRRDVHEAGTRGR